MILADHGVPLMLGATLLAVMAFALAMRVRSWPLWLSAYVLLLVALLLAWSFRVPPSGSPA